MHPSTAHRWSGWLGAAFTLAAPVAAALEVTADAQITSEYTSNTLRTESDEIGEWIQQPGMDLTASQDTATLQVDADYSLFRRAYQKDFWQDENRLVGGANILWQPVSERLDFLLRNNRRESTQRALQSSTQDNRQIVSTTEAGSTLRLQPRPADELQLEYTFLDIRTDETNTDSQRHNGSGRYIAQLSPNRSLTLAGMYSDIEYDTDEFRKADFVEATLGLAQASADVDLDLNAGYNWYDRAGRGKSSGPAFDGTLVWRMAVGTTWTATGLHRITDQSAALQERGEGVDENSDTNAAFKESRATLMLDQALGSTNTLALEAFYGREKYADDVARTNTRVGGGARFRRDMTPRTSVELFVNLSNRDFEDQLDDQDELLAGLSFHRRIGRSLNLTLGARYERREASTTESYDEWIGSVRLEYRLLGAR